MRSFRALLFAYFLQATLGAEIRQSVENADLAQQIAETRAEFGQEIQSLKEELADMKDSDIFFSATISSNDQSFAASATVTFDRQLANVGGGWVGGSTSRFTCPRTGHYFFTLSVGTRSGSGNRAHFNLVHQGNIVVTALSETADTHGGVTNSAILLCSAGQQVWVRCNNDGGCRTRGPSQGTVTTLTGFYVGA